MTGIVTATHTTGTEYVRHTTEMQIATLERVLVACVTLIISVVCLTYSVPVVQPFDFTLSSPWSLSHACVRTFIEHVSSPGVRGGGGGADLGGR